jgi:hypothetical protein
LYGDVVGADGNDSEIVDAVRGATSGALSLRQVAWAGNGGIGSGGAGGGGDARSILSAVNGEDGSLAAVVEAIGGNGGAGSTFREPGSATASVTATGDAGVTASASATGGGSLDWTPPGARGGEAIALVSAAGAGSLSAVSHAFGGASPLAGAALARATTLGGSGLAEASARSGSATHVLTHGVASAIGSVEVEAQTRMRDAWVSPPPGDPEVLALAVSFPLASDVESALAGNPDAAAARPAEVFGMALFGASDDGDASLLAGDITFHFPEPPFSQTQGLVLAFLDVSIAGAFDALHFRASWGSESIVDLTFEDAAEALAFFDDTVLAPEVSWLVPTSLRLDWQLEGGGQATSFRASGIFGTVPEPATGLLLALGLAALAVRRRPGRRVGQETKR